MKSESDAFRLKLIGSDNCFVGFFSVGFRIKYRWTRNLSIPIESCYRIIEDPIGSAVRYSSVNTTFLSYPVGCRSSSQCDHPHNIKKSLIGGMLFGLISIFNPKIKPSKGRNLDYYGFFIPKSTISWMWFELDRHWKSRTLVFFYKDWIWILFRF